MIYDGIELTDEQDTAIDYMLTDEDTIIQAPAGSGKTFILKAGSKLQQKNGKRGCYLAFNKAIADEGKATFPSNVDCRTGHSMAFGKEGYKYKHRFGKTTGAMLARSENIGSSDMFSSRPAKGYLILDTIRRFCYSDDPEITEKHVPYVGDKIKDQDVIDHYNIELPIQAKKIWEKMIDLDSKIPVEHDLYLKVWALNNPFIPKDFLLFDEAQDANPVILGVVRAQTHMQKIFVGDRYQQIYCQPEGTIITIGNKRQKKPISFLPIEKVTTDMNVVTYHNNTVFKQGKKINHITKILYKGDLIVASTENHKSKYIPKHQCIIRIGEELKDKHIVYLMKKGNNYRIGKVPYFYKSQDGTFGLGQRSAGESAEASWILSIHDSSGEALMYEAIYQTNFSIPGMRFQPGNRDVINTHKFWKLLGDNTKEGEYCLNIFNLLQDFPIWTCGHYAPVGVRRPFVTAAANLHTGMKMLPLDPTIPYKKSYVNCWETIDVSNEKYNGYVYSLEVADHHTYYADGLLTHNSWRGAQDAMTRVNAVHSTYLSQSFRFGDAIADVANKILQNYTPNNEHPIVIKGNPNQDSRVEPIIGCPDAIICRTNAGVITNVFDYIARGHRVYIQGGSGQLISLLIGARDLKNGKPTIVPDLALFSSWEEFLEYTNTEDGQAMKAFVNLIEDYGINELLNLLRRTEGSAMNAELVLTTAHKAKGLEWNNVKLGEDFQFPTSDKPLQSGEVNVLYVAATRALKTLDISECMAANVDAVLKMIQMEKR